MALVETKQEVDYVCCQLNLASYLLRIKGCFHILNRKELNILDIE